MMAIRAEVRRWRQPPDEGTETAEVSGLTDSRRVIRNSPAQAFADLHLIVSKVLISARRA